MYLQTVSCAEMFMANERGFEWLCRQLNPFFFVLESGSIPFSSGLRFIKLIILWALSVHQKLTGCPFAELSACLSVRSIMSSQLRKKCPSWLAIGGSPQRFCTRVICLPLTLCQRPWLFNLHVFRRARLTFYPLGVWTQSHDANDDSESDSANREEQESGPAKSISNFPKLDFSESLELNDDVDVSENDFSHFFVNNNNWADPRQTGRKYQRRFFLDIWRNPVIGSCPKA